MDLPLTLPYQQAEGIPVRSTARNQGPCGGMSVNSEDSCGTRERTEKNRDCMNSMFTSIHGPFFKFSVASSSHKHPEDLRQHAQRCQAQLLRAAVRGAATSTGACELSREDQPTPFAPSKELVSSTNLQDVSDIHKNRMQLT